MSSTGKYMDLFLEEARGLLQEAETCLANLGRDPDAADASHLHRSWHSLKGMAAALDLAPLVRLAHAAEERLPGAGSEAALRHHHTLQGEALAAATRYLAALQDGDPPPDIQETLVHLEAPLSSSGVTPRPAAPRLIAMPSASRVPATELDALLGEVVDMEARLASSDQPETTESGPRPEADLRHGLARLHRRLERLRHIPFATIVPALEQLVQGDTRRLDLQAGLDVQGGSHHLERGTLELLAEVLPHILRNALAHGIEAPSLRRQAGKEATGRICVQVQCRRRHVDVVIEDDGRGVSPRPPAGSQDAQDPAGSGPGEDLAPMLCRPGWSTMTQATQVAGRGIGLDAVRKRLAAAGGTLKIFRRHPHGLQVSLRVPATLAVTRCLVARIGRFHLAIPLHGIHSMEALPANAVPTVSPLENLLSGNEALPGGEPALELILRGASGEPFRFYVHQVLGRMDTVIRTVPGIATTGAMLGTALWQGRVPVVVFDPAGLCRLLPEQRHRRPPQPEDSPRGACPADG